MPKNHFKCMKDIDVSLFVGIKAFNSVSSAFIFPANISDKRL